MEVFCQVGPKVGMSKCAIKGFQNVPSLAQKHTSGQQSRAEQLSARYLRISYLTLTSQNKMLDPERQRSSQEMLSHKDVSEQDQWGVKTHETA